MKTGMSELDLTIKKVFEKAVPLVCFGPLPTNVKLAIKLKNRGIRDDQFIEVMKQIQEN